MWTAVDHFRPGILAWVVGKHDADTFRPLWQQVGTWQCYFYVTDGWKVYPCFIDSGDHIISKTYMTRVEGENTRLRHYLARLQTLKKVATASLSQDVMLLQIRRNAQTLNSVATALLKIPLTAELCLIHT